MLDPTLIQSIFKSSPKPSVILELNDPIYTIVDVNTSFLKSTGTKESDILQLGLFQAFPINPNGSNPDALRNLRESIKQVKATGKSHKMKLIKYDIPIRDTNLFEERYWETENTPIFNKKNEFTHVLHSVKDVTEKIQQITREQDIEKLLASNLQRYQSLFINNPDAVYSFDLAGKFVEANQPTADICETSLQHLLNISFLPLIRDVDKDRVYNNFLKASKGEIINYNTGLVTVKGNHKTLNVTNIPIIIKEQIIGVYGIAKDITVKILTEKALEDNRLKTKRILDQSKDVICTIDENGLFVDVNNASLNVWGYHPDDIIGRPYMDLVYGEDHDSTNAIAEKLMNGMDTSDFQNRYIHKNGSLVPIIWSAKWVTEDNLLYCVARDGTESEEAKEKIKSERNLLRTLIDALPDTVYYKDSNARKIISNKRDYTLLGAKNEEEVLGKTDLEVLNNSLGNIGYKHDLKILRTGEGLKDYEQVFIEHDLCLSTTKLPLYDESGNISGILGIGRDITNEINAQNKLKQVNKDLQNHVEELLKSNKELEQYAYVASHDLQEPLRAISTFLSLLEQKYHNILDKNGKRYLNFAIDGAVHMRQLISDLLELSKIGRADDFLEKVEIDLNKLISKIIVTDNTTRIKVSGAPLIWAPENSMARIFNNLISNAIKYKKKNEPLEIDVSCEDLGEYWQFSVSDNGIGIEEEYFERIFVLFQRLHNRAEYEGTGVGLSITKKIIESLGGKIWVDSILGTGSTFYFTIKK